MPVHRTRRIGTSIMTSLGATVACSSGALADPPQPVPLLVQETVVGTGLDQRNVQSIGGIAIVGAGQGYVASLRMRPPAPLVPWTPPLIWGTVSGVSPGTLETGSTEAPTIQALTDECIGAGWNYGAAVTSSLLARHTDLPNIPAAGLVDSLWEDGMLVAVQGEQFTSAGITRIWQNFRVIDMTADARRIWVTDDAPLAAPDDIRTRLFRMNDQGSRVTQLSGLGLYSGLPAPLAQKDCIVTAGFSSVATHYAAIVRLDGMSSSNDEAVVLDGLGWLPGGHLVREGDPMMITAARPEEAWGTLRAVAANAGNGPARTTVVSAATFSPVRGAGEVLARESGEHSPKTWGILLRDGQVVDGQTITGPFVGIRLNDRGDWLTCAGLVGETGLPQALILNGSILSKTGDRVWIRTETGSELAGTIRSFRAPHGIRLSIRQPDGSVAVLFTAVVEPDPEGLSGLPDRIDVLYRMVVVTGNPVPCAADWNANGMLTIDDLFLYLNAYFAGNGDFNGIGGTGIDDLFLYLNAYFTGC